MATCDVAPILCCPSPCLVSEVSVSHIYHCIVMGDGESEAHVATIDRGL